MCSNNSPTSGYPEGISYSPINADSSSTIRRANTFRKVFASNQREPSFQELRGSTRIFLDTADLKYYSEYLPRGLFFGVTTNPVLLEKAGVKCNLESLRRLTDDAFALGAEEFMCQAWGGSSAALISCGMDLASIDGRVVVKVPLTADGVEAARALSRLGCRVCMTACYSVHQVVTSAAVGAAYVAPYLGRISDSGRDGMEEVAAMVQAGAGLRSETRVLVASIRSAQQVGQLAARGANTFTVSPDVAQQMLNDQQTVTAAAEFERAAASGGRESGGGGIGFRI